jgi:hypothetical protein
MKSKVWILMIAIIGVVALATLQVLSFGASPRSGILAEDRPKPTPEPTPVPDVSHSTGFSGNVWSPSRLS